MEKEQLIAEEFGRNISNQTYNKRVRKFEWWLKAPCQGEQYTSNYTAGTLQLVAGNALALRYGINNLETGLRSGHLSDFLGSFSPKFSLRPIWPLVEHKVCLTPHLTLFFPQFCFDKKQLQLACERVIQLGYNAFLFGVHPCHRFKGSSEDFQLSEMSAVIHSYGLKLIVKPQVVPEGCEKEVFHNLLTEELLSEIDFLFWEALFQREEFASHPSSADRLMKELIVEEVIELEKAVAGRAGLIYFFPEGERISPEQQSRWFGEICDEVGKETVVSFSATIESSGDTAHPIWDALRSSPDISATPLLPIANFGAVGQGEGLWPVLTLRLMERCFSRMYRYPFAGVVALTGSIPGEGGLLDCNLWVAGQLMWREFSPSLLAETWFRAYRLDFLPVMPFLEEFYQHSLQLKTLLYHATKKQDVYQGNCRQIVPFLSSQLDLWEEVFRGQTFRPLFYDYFVPYLRDARRILHHCLRLCHVPATTMLKEEDLNNSFWTTVESSSGRVFGGDAEISLNSVPNRGEVGSVMEQIYLENRLF